MDPQGPGRRGSDAREHESQRVRRQLTNFDGAIWFIDARAARARNMRVYHWWPCD